MNKLRLLVFILFCGNSLFSQIYIPVSPTIYGEIKNRVVVKSAIGFPSRGTFTTNTNDVSPQIFYHTSDSSFYGWSPDKGYFMIASSTGSMPTVNMVSTSISGLRSLSNPSVNISYYTTDIKQQGFWYYDSTDHSSSDNTGTILVSGSKRFKRVFSDNINPYWFGAKGDGSNDDILALDKARIATPLGGHIHFPGGTFMVSRPWHLPQGITIDGDGDWSGIALYSQILPMSSFPADSSIIIANLGYVSIQGIYTNMQRRGGNWFTITGDAGNYDIRNNKILGVPANHWAIEVKDTTGSNGVCCTTIENNKFSDFDGGGIGGTRWGDNVHITNNNVFQLNNSSSYIVKMNFAPGAANFIFDKNNATGAAKGFEIDSASAPTIEHNQFEATIPVTNADTSWIVIKGYSLGGDINYNNINTHYPNAKNAITFNSANFVHVTGNQLENNASVVAIKTYPITTGILFTPTYGTTTLNDATNAVSTISTNGISNFQNGGIQAGRISIGVPPVTSWFNLVKQQNTQGQFGYNASITPLTLQSDLSNTGTDQTLTNRFYAWAFTAIGSHTLGEIGVRLKVTGGLTNINDNINLYLYSDSSGLPNNRIFTSLPVRMVSLNTAYTEYKFGGDFTLTNGNNYWIAIEISAPVTGNSILLDKGSGVLTTANVSNPIFSDWTVNTGLARYNIYGWTANAGNFFSENKSGAYGNSVNWYGIQGNSTNNFGGYFTSTNNIAGEFISLFNHAVQGSSNTGVGGYFNSLINSGVYAFSTSGNGVTGTSITNIGGQFISTSSLGSYSTSVNSLGGRWDSKNSGGGQINQTGTLDTANSSPVLSINNTLVTNSTGSKNSTGGILDLKQNATGTGLITGNLIRGLFNNTVKFRIDYNGNFKGGIDSVNMNLGSDATGDMYYRNSSGILTRIAHGTSAQALRFNGTTYVWTDTTAVTGGGGGASLTAANTWTTNGALSTPSQLFTGSWITGGTGTTNMGYITLQPTGTTASSTLSTAGTAFHINAPTGFTGNYVDWGLAGVSKFSVSSAGTVTAAGNFSGSGFTYGGAIQAVQGTTLSNFYVVGTNILGASSSTARYLVGGRNAQFRVGIGGATSTVATANNDISGLIVGDNNFTKATSGTHTLANGLSVLTQTVTSGTATITDFQNAYFGDAPTGGVSNWSANLGLTKFRANVNLNGVPTSTSTPLIVFHQTDSTLSQTSVLPTNITTSTRSLNDSSTSLATTAQIRLDSIRAEHIQGLIPLTNLPTKTIKLGQGLVSNSTGDSIWCSGPVVLNGSGNNVNTKSTGSTTIYTVPTGYLLVVTRVVAAVIESTSITAGASCSVTASSSGTIFSNVATGATATPKVYNFDAASGLSVWASAGETISFVVGTASTGTSQTYTVYLIGFLVPAS